MASRQPLSEGLLQQVKLSRPHWRCGTTLGPLAACKCQQDTNTNTNLSTCSMRRMYVFINLLALLTLDTVAVPPEAPPHCFPAAAPPPWVLRTPSNIVFDV